MHISNAYYTVYHLLSVICKRVHITHTVHNYDNIIYYYTYCKSLKTEIERDGDLRNGIRLDRVLFDDKRYNVQR